MRSLNQPRSCLSPNKSEYCFMCNLLNQTKTRCCVRQKNSLFFIHDRAFYKHDGLGFYAVRCCYVIIEKLTVKTATCMYAGSPNGLPRFFIFFIFILFIQPPPQRLLLATPRWLYSHHAAAHESTYHTTNQRPTDRPTNQPTSQQTASVTKMIRTRCMLLLLF